MEHWNCQITYKRSVTSPSSSASHYSLEVVELEVVLLDAGLEQLHQVFVSDRVGRQLAAGQRRGPLGLRRPGPPHRRLATAHRVEPGPRRLLAEVEVVLRPRPVTATDGDAEVALG